MLRKNRHGSSSSSSAEKRSSVSESFSKKKVTASKTHLTKKRPALRDVTNQRNVPLTSTITSFKPSVPCVSKSDKTKKESIVSSQKKGVSQDFLQDSKTLKSSDLAFSKDTCSTRSSQAKDSVAAFLSPRSVDAVRPAFTSMVCAPRRINISPSKSFSGSVSLDESMSTCDSLKSPEFEYIENEDTESVKSIEMKTSNILTISDISKVAGRVCDSDSIMKIEVSEIVDIDDNFKDTQLCAAIAHEIYENLSLSEASKRPSIDYMEKIQKDVNASMRAILIDWLVEVAEEYRLLPDTLFSTVNYIDRYLSVNVMDRRRLQMLGVACMMIAAKYEEICAPKVEEFCYITDHTYSREQVLQMEFDVLFSLKFELTAPTTRCFLRRFVLVAQRTCEVCLNSIDVLSKQLEYLADYLAELSLLEYCMLRFAPSLIAASATFLAIFILFPRIKPWNSTLRHYTGYQASELCECVNALHWLFRHGCHNLPAVREKYSQHKFKFVAKKYCSRSIPAELFQN